MSAAFEILFCLEIFDKMKIIFSSSTFIERIKSLNVISFKCIVHKLFCSYWLIIFFFHWHHVNSFFLIRTDQQLVVTLLSSSGQQFFGPTLPVLCLVRQFNNLKLFSSFVNLLKNQVYTLSSHVPSVMLFQL